MSSEQQTPDPIQPEDSPLNEAEVVEPSDVQPETEEAGFEAQNAEQNLIDRVIELEAKLQLSESKVEEQKDSVIRAHAESENVRRRAAQDIEKARKFALEKFANELLPVMDNMERAIDAADRDLDDLKPMLEGVELTLKSFQDALVKFGVEVVDPKGEAFDPAKHQAIGMQESADIAANTVITVMQKGYELNGRLIRPAMVMISKAAAAE